MSFLVYADGSRGNYTDYGSASGRRKLNLNPLTQPEPFPGKGMYSAQPLYDDCFLDPMQALYSGTQKDCLKFGGNVASQRAENEMRQNGTADLPDHFSRYGYNADTGTCSNGFCLGNHNGRYIVGELDLGKGIYADPPNMAPQSWYLKQKMLNANSYWDPHAPPKINQNI